MQETAFLHHFVGKLHDDMAAAVGDLSDDQLYHHPQGGVHAAFHAWHIIRTADNVFNFVCQDRNPPVWIRQNLHEAWGLPKAAQGTGMDLAEAQALRLPSNDALPEVHRRRQGRHPRLPRLHHRRRPRRRD